MHGENINQASYAENDALRNQLLKDTLQNATTNTDYYSQLYATCNVDSINTIEQLSGLPVTTKEDLRSAGNRAICRNLLPVRVQYTSGTTGEPLRIYKCHEESRFIREFFTELHSAHPVDRKPLVLAIDAPHHGTPTAIPVPYFILRCPPLDIHSAAYALILLGQEHCIRGVEPRVSVISGSHTELSLLTGFMLEQQGQMTCDVKTVFTTSRYCTARWRQLLSSAWKAPVVDRYSMTEIFGGATYCGHCKGFHFDPHVVPEIVHPITRSSVNSGTGVLLLTSLFPFVQLHPFIRYWTNDLFRIEHGLCGIPSYFSLGRLNHALYIPHLSDQPILTGADVIDTIDPLPIVARERCSSNIGGCTYDSLSGYPLASATYGDVDDAVVLTLTVYTTIDLRYYPQEQDVLSDHISQALARRSPCLASLIASGDITLNVTLTYENPRNPNAKAMSLEKKEQLWQKIYL